MKDAKGHGSDPRGGPAHQTGVNDASRAAAFNVWKAAYNQVNAAWDEAAAKVRALGGSSGPRGMTPDSVRADPEYRAAQTAAAAAEQRAKDFNKQYVKQFGPEIKAERDRVRQARLEKK